MSIYYRGNPLPEESVGELEAFQGDVSDAFALQECINRNGYAYIPGALNRDRVFAARGVVLQKLHEVGEIDAPIFDGIPTGTSNREEMVDDLGDWWKEVSECRAVRDITHGAELKGIMSKILGEPAVGTDYVILRVASGGQGTRFHYDHPFFNRYKGVRILTAWIPFGDLPFGKGTLSMVEGSMHFEDLVSQIRDVDVYSEPGRSVELDLEPEGLIAERNARLLTTDFRAGDVIIFEQMLLHGSFDSDTSTNKVRMSCDVRWQPASAELDDRYFGENPKGITGGGYAELNGAKPLPAKWHVR
ncbi:phytanoyl-CoA dioxygenase family protein [Ruegeria sp.]|uniref:phytanoyl-CoA dioxygenase family protein n=1 Tax=Ruegeria sp. TaxID=1879320 RepID=UPI003C7CB0F9